MSRTFVRHRPRPWGDPHDLALARAPHIRYGTRMLVTWRRWLSASALALVGLPLACSSSSGESTEPSPTLVTVVPSTFGQGVLCGDFPGAWKTYVATLTDVTDPTKPFVLASSNPVHCAMPVSFAWVVPGNQYTAEIDAYDRSDLVSFGGPSSGSRHVVDPATGEDVPPRWTARCGIAGETDPEVRQPTTAFLQANMVVGDCTPLQELLPSGNDTALVLDLASVRGNLLCGEDPGQVDRLRVSPEDPSLSSAVADCDQSLTFSSLEPEKTYRFLVEAFDTGATIARWATSCEGRTQEGITLPATCDPLSNRGALVVDINAILTAADHACASEDIVSYRAVVLGQALAAEQRSCQSNIVISGLDPASYQVVVDGFDGAGEERLSAFCEGTVKAGVATTVGCQVTRK